MKEEQIKSFLQKRSKAAIVLELLLNREYVTCSEIINFGCENLPIVFTTCPQKLIQTIRDNFGKDFVKSEEVPFYRTMYDSKGQAYKKSDSYTKYFLNKMGDFANV